MHLQTGRAWAIKESLRNLWNYQRKGWALRHWKAWYLLGDAFAPEARHQGRAHDQRPPAECADLLRASHHQRHERGAEFEDPDC